MYHQDAVVAVKELGLTFMKGDYAHAGFPEIAYSRFADALVSKGYKVGRVEQTETPDAMNDRVRGTKQDKTVRREVCKITTPGTKTFNVLDGEVSNAFSQYLFSFIEKVKLEFRLLIENNACSDSCFIFLFRSTLFKIKKYAHLAFALSIQLLAKYM